MSGCNSRSVTVYLWQINEDLQRKGPVRAGEDSDQIGPRCGQNVIDSVAGCDNALAASGGSGASQPADHVASLLGVKGLSQSKVRSSHFMPALYKEERKQDSQLH